MAVSSVRIGSNAYKFRDNISATLWIYFFTDTENPMRVGFSALWTTYTTYAPGLPTKTGAPNGTATASLYIGDTLIGTESLSVLTEEGQSTYSKNLLGANFTGARYITTGSQVLRPETPTVWYTLDASQATFSRAVKVVTQYGTLGTDTVTYSYYPDFSAAITAPSSVNFHQAFNFSISVPSLPGFSYLIEIYCREEATSTTHNLAQFTTTDPDYSGSYTFRMDPDYLLLKQYVSFADSCQVFISVTTYKNGTYTGYASKALIVKIPAITLSCPPAAATCGSPTLFFLNCSMTQFYGGDFQARIFAKANGVTVSVGRFTITGTSTQFTPESSTFGLLFKNSMSGSVTLAASIFYMDGDDEYLINNINSSGTYSSFTVNLLAADVKATPSATLTDVEGYFDLLHSYLIGQSRLQVAVNAGLKYGATLVSLRCEINNTIYTGTSFTTDYLASNASSLVITVTDSRGQTGTSTISIPLIDWEPPKVTQLDVHRGTYVGGVFTPNDNGNYVKIDWGIQIAPVDNQNDRSASLTGPVSTVELQLTSYTQTGSVIQAADTERSFDIVLTVEDSFDSFTRTVVLSTAGVVLDILAGGKGIGLGKVAEEQNCVEVSPQWSLKATNVYIGDQTLAEYIRSVVGSMS